ncbi:hypothetical protein KSP39_PZI022579 [Platanthera zijinensis]|uniref:Myb/SANT-like domain-containing protein n=1 Tax=Platanthera zijinensis TaxID=2320716 RepID=A0AAP0AVS9_9ASPA
MGKHKEGGVSANWEASDVLIFCDLCLKEIELGNRPTTHFNREGWVNLTTNFLARTGKSYDRTQMKNKWDQLKKDWKLWRDLKGRETGLGWDPIRKTIAASEDWWKERLKVIRVVLFILLIRIILFYFINLTPFYFHFRFIPLHGSFSSLGYLLS